MQIWGTSDSGSTAGRHPAGRSSTLLSSNFGALMVTEACRVRNADEGVRFPRAPTCACGIVDSAPALQAGHTGSIPVTRSSFCESSLAARHNFAKVVHVGSTPISRSKFVPECLSGDRTGFVNPHTNIGGSSPSSGSSFRRGRSSTGRALVLHTRGFEGSIPFASTSFQASCKRQADPFSGGVGHGLTGIDATWCMEHS